MSLLEFKAASKTYSPRRSLLMRLPFPGRNSPRGNAVNALAPVSLKVGAGESVGIVGESGAGKSTLAALAAGLVQPSAGSVTLNSAEDELTAGRNERLSRARQAQLIWQDAPGSLDPRMKIAASIAEPLKVHGLAAGGELEERVSLLFTEVGLGPDCARRYPHELSGGELQRAVIARALALDPKLLICDEPVSSLDARLKIQIAELLLRLNRERGLALLVIAHDLALIRKLTTRIFVMYKGHVVESGPTGDVLGTPLHPYTRMLVSSDPASPGWTERIMGEDAIAQWEYPANGAGEETCSFAAGCDEVEGVCRLMEPALVEVGGGRQVACRNLKRLS